MIGRSSWPWLLLVSLHASASHAGLSATERQIARSVDAGIPRALVLLERTVNQNSGTLHFEGVRATANLFAPEFERLGFRTRWVEGAAWGRAGHLLATRPGRSPARRVVLIGHLDTVFDADSPFQRYERLDEHHARGPGVSDMKGGIVVMLLALAALRDAGALDAFDLRVVLTGDEEKSGRPIELARRDLLEQARGCDVAIGFEDGAGDPRTPVVSRRSSSTWTLRTTGVAAHSSQIGRPQVGSGAVFEAARILNAWRDSLSGEAFLTLSPGLVLGGTRVTLEADGSRGDAAGRTNVVAESAVVRGDLRTLDPAQQARAVEAMQRIASRHLPRTGATLEFEEGYPPMAPSDGNRRLLAVYDSASRDLGHGGVEAVSPDRAGAADISFVAGLVPMAIDGIGLMGTGGHTVDETADLRTLPMNAKRIAVTMLRLRGASGAGRSGRASAGAQTSR